MRRSERLSDPLGWEGPMMTDDDRNVSDDQRRGRPDEELAALSW